MNFSVLVIHLINDEYIGMYLHFSAEGAGEGTGEGTDKGTDEE